MAVRVPPCQLRCFERKHMYQTYVTKVTGTDVAPLALQGQSRVFDCRSLASATVVLRYGPDVGSYLVQTLEKECEESSFAARMRVQLGKLPGSPPVEWTRPLTRRLQRLLGWGDVGATSADVMRAAKAGDRGELAELFPNAARLIMLDQVEYEHLVALNGAQHGAPLAALQDQALAAHKGQARAALEDRAEDREEDLEQEDAIPLRVVHEVLGQHTWSERPNHKAKCVHCEDWGPFECACGIGRVSSVGFHLRNRS